MILTCLHFLVWLVKNFFDTKTCPGHDVCSKDFKRGRKMREREKELEREGKRRN